MSNGKKTGKSRKKTPAASRKNDDAANQGTDGPVDISDDDVLDERSLPGLLTGLTGEVASGVSRMAARVGGASMQMGKALLLKPEQRKLLREAGHSLKDLRDLAGMTRKEVGDALKLSDMSWLKAVENGTATLSFELILRLAALYSRHDPLPFIIKYTRTYNPTLWKLLDDWGVGRLPLYFEREREFVNIFRNHDSVRELSDEAFEKLLKFTRAAFEMAVHFIVEEES